MRVMMIYGIIWGIGYDYIDICIPLVYIISLFVFVWGGRVLVIGTFVFGSLRWYILLGLGFVILGTLFCLWGGIGRCSHCVWGLGWWLGIGLPLGMWYSFLFIS